MKNEEDRLVPGVGCSWVTRFGCLGVSEETGLPGMTDQTMRSSSIYTETGVSSTVL